LTVRRQTYPGRGGLATKETKGRWRRRVPIIEPLRATLKELTVGRARNELMLNVIFRIRLAGRFRRVWRWPSSKGVNAGLRRWNCPL
jgi:hypothetical protein